MRTTRRQAIQAMDIFLREEAIYLREHNFRPLYMEAAIGLPPEQIGDTCGTPLDRAEPLEIATRGGSLLIRGRIDRIDRAADNSHYAIWDYKTGSPAKFRSGTFSQGRILQHYLYSLMAGRLITDGEIETVGYYFTSYRGRGERITYNPADLQDEGGEIIAGLRTLVAAGAYPATTDAKDCTYCDFKRICGDVKSLAARMKQMLQNCNDTKLDAMRKLRETEAGNDSDE
jgi:CRISPR/Cas system-associated exonuclease Cas4 (RecB family)